MMGDVAFGLPGVIEINQPLVAINQNIHRSMLAAKSVVRLQQPLFLVQSY